MDFLNRPENDYCHLFFLYIYIFIFSCSIRPLFPISAAAHSQKGKKRTLFHQLKLSDYEISLYSILSTIPPPPSISRFETHNDNFLSPYSSSFGSVSNLSVSPRPVRLNSAFGSDVPLLIEENQDRTHTISVSACIYSRYREREHRRIGSADRLFVDCGRKNHTHITRSECFTFLPLAEIGAHGRDFHRHSNYSLFSFFSSDLIIIIICISCVLYKSCIALPPESLLVLFLQKKIYSNIQKFL